MPPKRSKPVTSPPVAATTGGPDMPQVDGAGDEDAAPKVWVCGACTFQNKLGSSKCQVCATPKGTSSRKNIHRRAAESEQQAELRRLEQQKRRAAMAEKRRKELEEQADEHAKLQTQIQKAREADASKSVTPASSSSRAKPPVAVSPEDDKEGEDERGLKRKGGIGPGSRGGPGARIVSGMLKRLKAKDTIKTEITMNTTTVSIWASKMVGPEFGLNIVSEST